MIDFQKQHRLIFALVVCLSAISGRLVAQEGGGFDDFPVKAVEPTDEPMFKNSYTVPPTFLNSAERANGGGVDPFGKVRRIAPVTAQTVLEDAGIEFPPGASVVFNPRTSQLLVVNTEAQMEMVEMFLGHFVPAPERQVYVFVELIEVGAALYHDWMFENRITKDGTALRKQAQKWVKAGEATMIETAAVVARSGQRAKTQSVGQVYYPTDADPAMIPNKVDLEGAQTRAPIAAVSPVVFDRRDVGSTVEVDPVIGADNVTIDLNVSPEIVSEKGTIDWPPKGGDPLFTVSLPEFHTMKITTQVTTQHGKYTFLGTTTPLKPAVETQKRPLVMMFVRGDVATLEEQHEHFDWEPVEKK